MRFITPTRKVVLNGSTSASFSAMPMENIDTAKQGEEDGVLEPFETVVPLCGSWSGSAPGPPDARDLVNGFLQRTKRAHPAAEQAAPKQEHGDDDEDPEQEDERIGQEQGPGPLEQDEWNQVSTCVMEGCAIRPKPTQAMLMAQKL